ncbi:thioesterase family protein [Ferroglobus sp.]|uniref:acyl-CoA thioesterase n=1 Tax=Ferroglobus sp. TaxID=2614230 RepID=UPI0025B9C5C7|nr:thioesterase family protein [Ferroglobus sp.]
MLSFEVEVWFGDVDSFGHVNNVAIARYLETARMKYFVERLGFKKLEPIFVLRRIEIDYLSPLYLGETAVVEIWVERVGNTSFDFGYRIYEKNSGREIVKAKSVQVWYDVRENKKLPIPEDIREIMVKDVRRGE